MFRIQFVANRSSKTEYCITDGWVKALTDFLYIYITEESPNNIIIFSDTHVWDLYKNEINSAFDSITRPLIPLIIPPGEESKDINILTDLIKVLSKKRICKRDLLICLGGGVCCDLCGSLALLYMRGLNYISVPTSLMAQIDGAIGGKVGLNISSRKNVLGGFHHPLKVIIDPVFLDTLPRLHFISAFAEAIKLAIILEKGMLLQYLGENAGALMNKDRDKLIRLIKYCVDFKLDLIKDDPYESNLNRELNLGHAVAHALERLPIMGGGRTPTHGEAVAIGLATVIRYAFISDYCSRERAMKLLDILQNYTLPITPAKFHKDDIFEQLNRILEHRGGALRLVVPKTEGGVHILSDADLNVIIRCLLPSQKGLSDNAVSTQ